MIETKSFRLKQKQKKNVKNGYLKSRNLSEEKKTHPSTNIPLLSYRNSEQ